MGNIGNRGEIRNIVKRGNKGSTGNVKKSIRTIEDLGKWGKMNKWKIEKEGNKLRKGNGE